MLRASLMIFLCFQTVGPTLTSEEVPSVYRDNRVLVRYEGIEPDQAESIAQVVGAARAAAETRYGFDLPETIIVEVRTDARNRPRLFTDGNDRLFLSVRRAADLRRPSESGIFHLYGLCHEIGHLAMYRTIKQHDWLTSAAAEGWAHYIGSQLVDDVFEARGADAWWDAYDYRSDGTARLDKQLAEPEKSDVTQAAELWMQLAELTGDQGLSDLLVAWGSAQIDPADPGAAARAALMKAHPGDRAADWWNRAEPLMVFAQPESGFRGKTPAKADLMKRPELLKHDDGKAAGKGSVAGSGHAVSFNAPGPGWFLTSVDIHGSRYGHPQAPNEDFRVWLCDERGAVIRQFEFPYSRFRRGEPTWIRLQVEPTEIPESFVIVVGFDPTATKGVFVSRDRESSGRSRLMLPGKPSRAVNNGDWLIRARVDQLKTADALRADG